MKNIAVKLTNISKKYTLRHEKPTLVENIFRTKKPEQFWALKNINISVKKGEKLGIIGPNGSGKTTLLKIISGITAPTFGTVTTNEKIVSLIELGAGFQPELTGEENILLNGMLIGMSKREIKSKIHDIIDFADIGHFIDVPFYTYSAGMALRLGFSIAAYSDPDVLILDENMSLGDQEFFAKSQIKLNKFFKQKKTVIIVSHIMQLIKKYCSQVILIQNGKIIETGKFSKVIKYY